MTTRKPAEFPILTAPPSRRRSRRSAVRGALAGFAAWLVTGCSTPGPVHLYSLSATPAEIHDIALDGRDVAREVPSFCEPNDAVVGFGYDPFTDHFFLRLAPGNRIRVVDRPARKIKREFTIAGGPETAGDLAISPRDGHLYLIDAATTDLVETNRFGQVLGRIRLEGRTTAAVALAYDPEQREFFALDADGRGLDRYDLAGHRITHGMLARTIKPSLAYNADTRELLAPLADSPNEVGVFDREGKALRTLPLASGDTLVDVGPHSLIRVF